MLTLHELCTQPPTGLPPSLTLCVLPVRRCLIAAPHFLHWQRHFADLFVSLIYFSVFLSPCSYCHCGGDCFSRPPSSAGHPFSFKFCDLASWESDYWTLFPPAGWPCKNRVLAAFSHKYAPPMRTQGTAPATFVRMHEAVESRLSCHFVRLSSRSPHYFLGEQKRV